MVHNVTLIILDGQPMTSGYAALRAHLCTSSSLFEMRLLLRLGDESQRDLSALVHYSLPETSQVDICLFLIALITIDPVTLDLHPSKSPKTSAP